MNIFVLDRDPIVASWYHCDKHVGKMLLETCQLLSSAHHHYDSVWASHWRIYAPTHKNHPCSVWVRQTRQNYEWLRDLGAGLADQYELRFRRGHASSLVLREALWHPPDGIPDNGRTPFALAMPNVFKGTDAVLAYRMFYCTKQFAAWTRTPVPIWFDASVRGTLVQTP